MLGLPFKDTARDTAKRNSIDDMHTENLRLCAVDIYSCDLEKLNVRSQMYKDPEACETFVFGIATSNNFI